MPVLNTIKDSEIQYLKQRVIALESELKKAHKNNSRHIVRQGHCCYASGRGRVRPHA